MQTLPKPSRARKKNQKPANREHLRPVRVPFFLFPLFPFFFLVCPLRPNPPLRFAPSAWFFPLFRLAAMGTRYAGCEYRLDVPKIAPPESSAKTRDSDNMCSRRCVVSHGRIFCQNRPKERERRRGGRIKEPRKENGPTRRTRGDGHGLGKKGRKTSKSVFFLACLFPCVFHEKQSEISIWKTLSKITFSIGLVVSPDVAKNLGLWSGVCDVAPQYK